MSEVLVLGAGMVGVSTALALQSRGHDVTIIDRNSPGRETSYGNAGLIQTEAVEPYAMPLAPGALMQIAMGRGYDVKWNIPGLLSQAGAVWAYAWNSLPAAHRRASRTWGKLIRQSTERHGPLIQAAGADNIIRRDGYIEIHRTPKKMDQARKSVERFLTEFGVEAKILDGKQLRALEPSIKVEVEGATHWSDSWNCSDPGGLVARYAALFERQGGRIINGDAGDLHRKGAAWVADEAEGEHAVVALGPWSPMMLGRFGLKVPMVYKRGYHRHYHMDAPPHHPIADFGNSVVLSPMRRGLRIATAAELTRNPRLTPPQLSHGEEAAKELFDIGAPVEAEPWTGRRPCMPDMLPVVGRVPDQANLWAHFGHGHQGFTLGPVTAEILADELDGGQGWAELQPDRLKR
ncbi:FAD-dependent oxidoreductase [Paracoccus sp. R12_1]|jgi:D-amino-acid dehydrogenase|uniref:NAD(P)/FAD-dependent oxidoreductase n=1 Tax=unclassified Paracoccus (in: a-proteobacteria) TaxID=2688777 RepID=UPI001AD98EC5|nr:MULTISPECIES: FAD-dependent oxidoreductase [unclassified Paracoccus (in: a-proteobacteria)]MBO9454466.1 FAD-dependent oxidoreductase [Paracoccus sp. R12_2]MBO9486020.1 FAD-dependent oxidoreductase [Paracoccus sp. R12_1]